MTFHWFVTYFYVLNLKIFKIERISTQFSEMLESLTIVQNSTISKTENTTIPEISKLKALQMFFFKKKM
jgi:hypothetical protein